MFGKNHLFRGAALAGAFTLATIAAHATNVACVGNSITEGYGIWSEKKYPEHLQELLGEGYTATNFGASSMTYDSKFFTDKCMWNGAEKYNYYYGQYEKEKLYTDYEALIDTFAHLPSAPEIFATLQPYSNYCDWGIMDTAIVNQINPVIKETAIKKGVNIIDLHTLFQTPEWFLDDSVHPNAVGAQELAKIVNKYITFAKPALKQDQATLQVNGESFGIRWYKDGKLLEGNADTPLKLTGTGKYRALVKVENGNDSWILSEEIEVKSLGETAGIKPRKKAAAQPKAHKLHHKVDVKGRTVERK